MSVHGFADSGIGGRPENQDDFGFFDTPSGFLAIVCDGMGGGPGGKTASYMAKYEIAKALSECNPEMPRENAVKMAVSRAHEAMQKKMNAIPSLSGMGSTFVAVIINKDSIVIAHAGDSRCYIFRGKRCIYQSTDHSLVSELVKNKALTEEEARKSPQSNIITRGLGSVSNNVPEIDEIPYKKGDRVVLCSDGIWGVLPAKDLKERLTRKVNPDIIVSDLSAEVDNIGNLNGGFHDNHTLIIFDIDTDSSATVKEPDKKIVVLGCMAGAILIGLACYYIIPLLEKDSSSTDKNNMVVSGIRSSNGSPGASDIPNPDTPIIGDTLPVIDPLQDLDSGNNDSDKTDTREISTDSLKKIVRENNPVNTGEDTGSKSKGDTADNNKNPSGRDKKMVIPKDALARMRQILEDAKKIKASSEKEGAKELEDYHNKAKELSSSLLSDKYTEKGNRFRTRLKTNIENKKWYINRTEGNKGNYYEVAYGTLKLLDESIILLDSISAERHTK